MCNNTDRGNLQSRKPCFTASLSTVNLIWTDPGSNLDLSGERPDTKLLSWNKEPFESWK